MHTDLTAPFLLIQRNGRSLEFADLQALACAVRAARITISDHHVVWTTIQNHAASALYGEWIVRDDHGRIVREAEVKAARPDVAYRHWLLCQGPRPGVVHAASLGLPIPGTGHRGGRYRDILREPAHHRARRAHAAMHMDEQDGLRPTGTIPRPPTNWDDILRSDYNHRTWKRHRKTQWRVG